MKPKGKRLLKVSGIIAVILGMVVVFAGFYIMLNAMSYGGMDGTPSEEQYRSMKYLNLGGIYIMVSGIIYCIAGFVGTINADDADYAKKCRLYGMVMLLICLINIIILLLWGNITAGLSVIITVVPALIAGAYLAGAVLNLNSAKE